MNITRRGFIYSAAALVALRATRQITLAEDSKPASPPPFQGKVEAIKLENDLYAFTGAGGNSTAYFNKNRLLMIDSGIPGRGDDLLMEAGKLAPDARHKTLLNTHWHFDHAGGNDAFAAAGYQIIGSTACRERLGQTINLEDMGMTAQPLPEALRPSVTFDQTLMIHEPTSVRLTKVAPAHTDGDVIAFIEKYNILITGDLIFNGMYPVIDRATGGSLDGMIAAAKMLLTLGDAKTRIIPGHGPVGDKSVISNHLELLTKVHEILSPIGAKKATMDEVLAAKPLEPLDEKWGRGFLRSPVFTKMAYGQWLTK